jgi:uroporphyrinogen-III synthase
MHLLLTRPQADAERTAAALRARGHRVTVAPLLRIEAVDDADIGADPFAAILVTSANAALVARRRGAETLRALPVFAVGDRSAQAMREAGFANVVSSGGDVDDLAHHVAGHVKSGALLLYLAGADRSGDFAGALLAQGFGVRTAVVYRAVAAAALPAAARDALTAGADGALHFSRRSAETYVRVADDAGVAERAVRMLAHFCLSAPVAEPLMKAGASDVRIAPEPTEAALLALVPAS